MLSSTVAGAGGSLVHVGARILVVGLALTAFPGGSSAALLAQSSLSRCDDHDDQIDCREKLLISMVVENSKMYETEYLEVSVGCVGEDRCLESNMTIGLTKTPVFLLYSLSNPRMFNGRPYEEYVQSGYGSGRGTCVDSEFRSDATCGWATSGGNDVVDSQGFCCMCPSLGGEKIYRGFRDCSYSLAWMLDGTPSSAHCLRYDDNWWYRGYHIGTYQIDFEIQVHITRATMAHANATDHTSTSEKTDAGVDVDVDSAANATKATNGTNGANGIISETLALSPTRTIVPSSRGDIVAELVGDFAAYAELSSLQGHWLMIPVQPGLSPNQVLSSNLDMWSIFDPSMVSTAGECDKIGVSYTSFKHQNDACDRPFGSCLNNQIFHFESEDQSRMERGLAPLYNVRRYGGGETNVGQAHQLPEGLVLKLPMAQMRSSVVTLSVDADELIFVTHAGRAAITQAWLADFIAIEEAGLLSVSVNNTSSKPAMFYVSVIECTADVLPVIQQSAAIQAGVVRTFEFDVRASTDLASTNATCSVVVANALGDVTDSRKIHFSMNATDYGPLVEQNASDGGNQPGNPPGYSTCANQCPNILSLKCSLLRRCWKRLFNGTAIIGGLLAFIYGVYASIPLIRRLRARGGRSPREEPAWMISNPSYATAVPDWNQRRTDSKKGSRLAAAPTADRPIAFQTGE
jgi:hypothetical protein